MGHVKKPIDLMSRLVTTAKRTTNGPTTMVLLNCFSKCKGNLKFKCHSSDYKWIDLDSVISAASLSYNAGTKLYNVDLANATCL